MLPFLKLHDSLVVAHLFTNTFLISTALANNSPQTCYRHISTAAAAVATAATAANVAAATTASVAAAFG